MRGSWGMVLVSIAASNLVGCLYDPTDECLNCTATSSSSGGAGGGGGAGGEGGSGANAGSGGVGGGEPCDGACSGTTPICDEMADKCVECAGHADCTEPQAGQCESGTCVPCSESEQCEGVSGAGVCSEGTCVECALGEEEACSGTCDLLEHTCVSVGPGSVSNCETCSNDLQCADGHRCIPMDFDGSPHGHYCLREPAPGCDKPYTVPINKPSISDAPATDYCGIEQDLATCEAVLALVNDWRCTGTEGMCGPAGDAEVPVLGAICRKVGLNDDRCTYACSGASDCLAGGAGSTCGGSPAPTWCGG